MRTRLTEGRFLARNVVWNLLGQLLPIAVGLIVVPPLVRGLGVERFGILSLAWMVVAYFGLFDLGLGRALTKLVSDRLAQHQEAGIGPLARTAVVLMLALGALGTLVAWSATPWLVREGLKVSPGAIGEAIAALYWLGAAIPLITVTSGLRGVLEAHQRFDITNAIRMPMSTLSFLAPLLVLPVSRSLEAVVLSLLAVRLAACLAHAAACWRVLPALRTARLFDASLVPEVLRLGGWMTVTNIVGPMMAYLDRFLVGILLTAAAVAYYTVPFDLVTRLLVIPTAVVGVLFPAFAFAFSADRERSVVLFARGTKYIFLCLFPLLLLVVTFAPEGLEFWVGAAFSSQGTPALRWLAVGVLGNAVAQVPFAFLQAGGRPDLTARLHLAELPAYLFLVWLLTTRLGITGTAMAWAARTVGDAVLLFVLAARFLPGTRRVLRALAPAAAGAAGLFVLCSQPVALPIRAIAAGLGVSAVAAIAWFVVLSREERQQVLRFTSPLGLN